MCEHVTTPTNVTCLPFWVTAPWGQQDPPHHQTRTHHQADDIHWRSVVISNLQRGGRSVACIIICMLTVMFWCLDSSNTSQWRDSTLLTTFQMTWLCSAGAPLSYELTSLFGRHKAETARSYLIRQHTFDTFCPLSSNLFLTDTLRQDQIWKYGQTLFIDNKIKFVTPYVTQYHILLYDETNVKI